MDFTSTSHALVPGANTLNIPAVICGENRSWWVVGRSVGRWVCGWVGRRVGRRVGGSVGRSGRLVGRLIKWLHAYDMDAYFE
jgi:hypothetical protein